MPVSFLAMWNFRQHPEPFRHALQLVVSFALVMPFIVATAQNVSTAPKLDSSTRRAVVQRIEDGIDANYVFPELKPALRARLEQSLRDGRYDVSEPGVFANRGTDDLEAVSHDGHLYLNYDPEEYAAAIAPPSSDAGLDSYRMRAAVRTNSGLIKQEILPGNVRYLRVESFRWVPDFSASAYDAAFRFLSDGDAAILDLRENGGGNSDAADRLMDLVTPLAKRKPVYVLVDGHVASAAEAVSYGLQQSKLATIVGATTYGAANNNKKIPIAPQFILSVSYNRPINPSTGTNWEGVGVVPDIKVRASVALAAAELAAYRQLKSTPATTAEKAAEYDWGTVAAEAQLEPVVMPPAHLRALAGNYGTISIQYENGTLFLSRSDRPKWDKNLRLTPLRSDGTFLVEGSDDLRLRFTKDGLDLLHGSEEAREPFLRTSPTQ